MFKLLKEYLEYIKVRNKVELIQPNEGVLAFLRSSNLEQEEKLNSLVLYQLQKELVNSNITQEYYRGFRQALIWREQYMKTSKKGLDK